MLKAFLFTGALAILFGTQLVQGLRCYHCISFGQPECTNVTEVTCNQEIANETSTQMRKFQKVPDVTSNNFECIWFNHTRINNEITFKSVIRSCAYKEIGACSDSKARFIITGSASGCRSCNKDLCNRNPAATFTPSLLTLPIALMSLLTVKFILS